MKKSYNPTYAQNPPYSPNPPHHHRPRFPVDCHRRRRLYPPPAVLRPNFVVQLISGTALNRVDVKSLISKLGMCPEDFVFSANGRIGSLYFGQWVDALSGMVSLWESRLNGAHELSPKLVANVVVPSDSDELEERLRVLFCEHVRGLMEGELAKKWQRRKDEKSDEIAGVSLTLSNRNRLCGVNKLLEKKKVLVQERDLIVKRLREFKTALRCILRRLGSKSEELEVEVKDFSEVDMDVFRFEGKRPDWGRIHAFISRECKRLESGLPIYVYRQDILRKIHGEQVFVQFLVRKCDC